LPIHLTECNQSITFFDVSTVAYNCKNENFLREYLAWLSTLNIRTTVRGCVALLAALLENTARFLLGNGMQASLRRALYLSQHFHISMFSFSFSSHSQC
jgi:hypothetical protein